jgi:hypothetical protein
MQAYNEATKMWWSKGTEFSIISRWNSPHIPSVILRIEVLSFEEEDRGVLFLILLPFQAFKPSFLYQPKRLV